MISQDYVLFEDFLTMENVITLEQFDKVYAFSKENRVNYIEIITKVFKFNSYPVVIDKISRFYNLELIKYETPSSLCPFLEKNEFPVNIDNELANKVDLTDVLSMEAFPAKLENDELTLVATVPYTHKALLFYKTFFNIEKIKYVWVDRKYFICLVRTVYDNQFQKKTLEGLFPRPVEETAYSVFSQKQAVLFGALTLVIIFGLYLSPLTTFITANFLIQLFYIISIGYKLFLSLFGELETSAEQVRRIMKNLKEEELPFYTILIPVYKEKEVIQTLLNSIANLDYPKERMEIIVLMEEDDKETIDGVDESLSQNGILKEYNFVPLVVPDYQPRTKPKACNYGLLFARGKHLVIYDAEDIPETNQLKMAVSAFKYFPSKYICFQAHLNYYNTDYNFLTKMFTLEYSYWFDYMLPGLSKLNLPIPLGGTSNHFRTDKLMELGGWDPYNTTEDADLGMRAYLHGYKVGIIDSTTYEEANSKLSNWIRQRSRWIKGYMQTWLVYTRKPIKMIKEAGLKGFLSFNLLVGGTPLTFLVNPILWVIFILWVLTRTELIEPIFPPEVYYLAIINLTIGNFLVIYLNLLPIFKRKLYRLLPYAFLNPAYWILHSIAAYKALWQLFSKPFYWEKTDHGLTKDINLQEKISPLKEKI